jgi:hypothetical protein
MGLWYTFCPPPQVLGRYLSVIQRPFLPHGNIPDAITRPLWLLANWRLLSAFRNIETDQLNELGATIDKMALALHLSP